VAHTLLSQAHESQTGAADWREVAEKRGMQWALTRFGRKAWGLRKEEV